ncbi:hypothetical protein M9458_001121, partial [Cirrhinus mrigala]
CVSPAQDLPPVGHSAFRKLLFPLLHWCSYSTAAERPSAGQRLQRVHTAFLRLAR